ncbi:hypothetical protein DL96DRAFT_1624511 [Flagelloscypha sp. PMI_526]|nr:hypothetical protein DL96DRAFT_1624511 [Flagelloscypha sp. PMI_526]
MASYQNGRTQIGTCYPIHRSVVHTVILAIISFPHSVTLESFGMVFLPYPNSSSSILRCCFGQGLKGIWKIFDQVVVGIFDILWFLGQVFGSGCVAIHSWSAFGMDWLRLVVGLGTPGESSCWLLIRNGKEVRCTG